MTGFSLIPWVATDKFELTALISKQIFSSEWSRAVIKLKRYLTVCFNLIRSFKSSERTTKLNLFCVVIVWIGIGLIWV